MTWREHARCFLYVTGMTAAVMIIACLIFGWLGAVVWAMWEHGFMAGLLVMVAPIGFGMGIDWCLQERDRV